MTDMPERSDLTVDQHRMIASDATPSRVWLIPPPGDPTWYAGSWKSNPLTVVVGDVPYVPESRALAAEAERDVARDQRNGLEQEADAASAEVGRLVMEGIALRAEVAALEAERDAAHRAIETWQREASGYASEADTLRARVAALTADKEALVPLMQAVDAMAWTAGANVPPGIHFTTAKGLEEFLSILNAARRIVWGGTDD